MVEDKYPTYEELEKEYRKASEAQDRGEFFFRWIYGPVDRGYFNAEGDPVSMKTYDYTVMTDEDFPTIVVGGMFPRPQQAAQPRPLRHGERFTLNKREHKLIFSNETEDEVTIEVVGKEERK